MEQIAQGLYRIGVPLPGNPLRELNSYFLRGQERDLLIDTGFCRPECRAALESALRELGSGPERLDLYITHYHADHLGLARELAGPDSTIYMGSQDFYYYRDRARTEAGIARRRRELRAEGVPEEMLEEFYSTDPSIVMNAGAPDARFRPLEAGTVLSCGPYVLRVLCVPGHTPGNTMLWEEKQRIMFTGDHVLFDITPNITSWSGVDDSLGDYLQSLRQVRDYPVNLALPGHRKGGDYRARIDALLAHHDRRIQETLQIVRQNPGLSAYEITPKLHWSIRARSWESFPTTQKFFATGECLAHLDYMRLRGILRRERIGDIWRYFAG